MAEWKREHAVFEGVTWSWFEAGSAAAGTTLVLLHGGGGTGKGFAAQMEALGDTVRVLAPDLPGFGQSDRHPAVHRVDDMPPVLAGWMEALRLPPVVLGGNSMGGRVALWMAAGDDTRRHVRALILLDGLGIGIRGIPIQNPLTFPPERFVEGLVYDAERYRRLTPYRSLEDLAELQRGRQVFGEYHAAQPAADPEATAVLSRIAVPTLVIWGKEDRVIPVEYGRALTSHLRDAEMVVLEHCGHLPHVEQPQLVNRLIAEFIDRLPA